MRLPDPRDKPFHTVAETVPYLPEGIGEKAIRAAIDAGQIPSVRVGRRILVPTAALWALVGLTPDSSAADPATGSAATPKLTLAKGVHDNGDTPPAA